MNFSFKKIDKFWIIFISCFFIIIAYSVYRKLYEKEKFEKTSFVLGNLKEKGKVTAKGGPYAVFVYTVNNEYFDVDIWGDFKDSSDTKYYCIEYSIEDPTVARLARLSECSE